MTGYGVIVGNSVAGHVIRVEGCLGVIPGLFKMGCLLVLSSHPLSYHVFV